MLGVPRIERDRRPSRAPRGRKVWALLAYLLRHEGPVSRQHLAGLLFEDAEDPLAALRWNLSELRRVIGEETLRGESIELMLGTGAWVDLTVVASGTWAEALCVPGLDRELLEGMHFAGCPSFDIWLATERRHLRATAEAVLREAALARLATGALVEAVDLAARLVRQNPLDENFQVLLVRCLAAAGDGVGAARQVASCRGLFERELGIRPGPALDAAMRTVTSTPTARPATGRTAALAQMVAGEAAIGAGALDAGLECLRRAIVDADASKDDALRARARVALGGALVHAARGRDEEGATALHEAIAMGRGAHPLSAAAACRELGYIEFLRGRSERATVWLREAATHAGHERAEQARIAAVDGCVLSDTAHYTAALARLSDAVTLAESVGDMKQTAFALSMVGRAHLLTGDLFEAARALGRSLAIAEQVSAALLPWPLSLRAEVDLLRGDVDAAAERFDKAFALGCHLGDPCWEGISGRGRGRVAEARGDPQAAVEILVDSIARSKRLPDAYLWATAYCLDALCDVATRHAMPQSPAWIDELHTVAARSGMREFTLHAYRHRAMLGDKASGTAAHALAGQIDNPRLMEDCWAEAACNGHRALTRTG